MKGEIAQICPKIKLQRGFALEREITGLGMRRPHSEPTMRISVFRV
jgi:hypothetical protein